MRDSDIGGILFLNVCFCSFLLSFSNLGLDKVHPLFIDLSGSVKPFFRTEVISEIFIHSYSPFV